MSLVLSVDTQSNIEYAAYLLNSILEHAEADTFCCFSHLMGEIRDHFIKKLDNSSIGIGKHYIFEIKGRGDFVILLHVMLR